MIANKEELNEEAKINKIKQSYSFLKILIYIFIKIGES